MLQLPKQEQFFQTLNNWRRSSHLPKRIMDTPKPAKSRLPRVLYFVSAREERGEKVMGGEKIEEINILFGMLTPLHYSLNLMFGFGEK